MTVCVRTMLAVTALISAASHAHADEDESGFYGSVFVSGDVPTSPTGSDHFSHDVPPALDSTLDGGFAVGGALGRSWSGLGQVVPRTELELSYQRGSSDTTGLVGPDPLSSFNNTDESASTALVGKILLDVPIGESMLTPYLGAGVGIRLNDQGFTPGNGLPLDGTGDDYSAQVLAGVSHSLADELDVSLDGRYQRSLEGNSGKSSSGKADDESLGIFSLFVRLRAKF